jgi:hypothetical protein
MTSEESHLAVVISVAIAAFLALLNHATVCGEQHECVRRGTCYSLNSGGALDFSCSFRTTVTPAGFALLNLTEQYSTMQALERGVCAPGLRQQVDVQTGALRCVRKRLYPVALNEEIGDPSGTSFHQRYCGRWIDAGSVAHGSQKWAFYDDGSTAEAVEDLIRAKGNAHIATTDVAKFRATCRTMVTANSAGASAKQAYGLLSPRLVAASLDDALETVGYLASHYCDGPALVGISERDNRFVARVVAGGLLSARDLRSALFVAGETREVRDRAEAFVGAMASVGVAEVPGTTEAQARVVARGSHAGTWIDGYVGPSFSLSHEEANEPLGRFVSAYAAQGVEQALGYLKGVAAVCALSARSVVAGEEGNVIPLMVSGMEAPRARPPTAAALGRLLEADRDLFSTHAAALANASTVRLSSLSAIASATHRTAREVCLDAAKRIFPDDFDRLAFNALITPTLYARLETVASTIRQATELTITEDLIGRVFYQYTNRAAAAEKVGAARVRIAGAPRGSWAGVQRDFRGPDLASDDTAIAIILKQARAVFLDRLLPVVSNLDVCEHPALYAGESRNAYLLLGSTSACVMLLPGLVVPPFADERYDDASLYTRLGWVLAHEFSHVTAADNQWDLAYTNALLSAYRDETHVEAIADLGAAAAVMRLPFVRNDTVCASVSQLFCGRVGWAWPEPKRRHPATNLRGDNVCSFLQEYF